MSWPLPIVASMQVSPALIMRLIRCWASMVKGVYGMINIKIKRCLGCKNNGNLKLFACRLVSVADLIKVTGRVCWLININSRVGYGENY